MKGIILNRDAADAVMRDNKKMVEILTRVPVIAQERMKRPSPSMRRHWPDCMDRGCRMDLVEKDLKYIRHPCSQMKDYEELKPVIIDRGEGVFLYDKEGKRTLTSSGRAVVQPAGALQSNDQRSTHRPGLAGAIWGFSRTFRMNRRSLCANS